MDILRFLPKNEYDAAVSASAPTAANPFATISDLGAYVPIAGNTGNPMTGDLVMGSARKISSSNGAFIEFDAAANRITLQNRDDAFNKANMYILGDNTLVFQAGNFGFVDGFADNKITPGSIDFNLYNNPFSKWGRFGMINNSSAAFSPFDFASFPAYAAIRNVTINQNTESIFCAGRDYIAKSNDGMYSNRYYLSKNNESFELAIEHETVTVSDKVATFQNKTGTVALLSDIGLAGIYGANGTVLSNHVATITDQLTFTGGTVRVGNTLELTSQSNFGSVGTFGHTLSESALYFRNTVAGNIATIVNAPTDKDIAMSINGTESWRFKSTGELQSSTSTGGLKLRLHTAGYGLGIQSELFEIIGKDAISSFTFGHGTTGSLTRLMTLTGAGNLGVGTNTPTGGRVHIKSGSLENSLALEDSLGTVWLNATDSKLLGVGAGTPLKPLHVFGETQLDGHTFVPTSQVFFGAGNSLVGNARLRVDGVSGGSVVSFRSFTGTSLLTIDDDATMIINASHEDSTMNLGVTGGNAKFRMRMKATDVYGIRHETFGGAITLSTLADGTVGIGTGTTSSRLTVNGDVETTNNTNGFIVLDRTNGTRYRIYTDGGVLNTEAA
jgi:hypothetical protein